ncbi:MAG TPA: hypothetical protein VGG64_17705 [Pirellulales bacterium]
MTMRFVPDGETRLYGSAEFQAGLEEIRRSVRAKYAAEYGAAGYWRRVMLARCVAAEIKREIAKVSPSRESLYFCQ